MIDKSLPKNVIITSMELGGVGWFTSILSEIHKKMFGSPIRWNYEISRFEATRERRPLPKGWCTVWNARPRELVNRGYDKVLGLQKSLEDAIYSHTLYHRIEVVEKYNDLRDAIDWIMSYYPGFFGTIKRKWLRMEVPCKHEKYKRFHMDALNRYTVKSFEEVLDFLEFPNDERPSNAELFAIILKTWFDVKNSWVYLAEKLIELIAQFRPMLLPVKVYRDWEAYSNVSRTKDYVLSPGIKKINALYMNDLKLKEV